MIEGKWFKLADLEEFEKHFGAQPFYRVIEADMRDQKVRLASGEWLHYLAREYRHGDYRKQERMRRVMLQPVDTWKPPKAEKTQ